VESAAAVKIGILQPVVIHPVLIDLAIHKHIALLLGGVGGGDHVAHQNGGPQIVFPAPEDVIALHTRLGLSDPDELDIVVGIEGGGEGGEDYGKGGLTG